jgi:hypothetical protein
VNVLSWNLGRRKDERPWLLLRDVLKPDVALLQEATVPLDAEKHWRVAQSQKYSGQSWGCVILARRDWALTKHVPDERTVLAAQA